MKQVWIYICIHTYTQSRLFIYTYKNTYILIYAHIYIYTYTHIHIYIYMYTHIYAYTYTHTCICTPAHTYILMHIYTHIYSSYIYANIHLSSGNILYYIIYVCSLVRQIMFNIPTLHTLLPHS